MREFSPLLRQAREGFRHLGDAAHFLGFVPRHGGLLLDAVADRERLHLLEFIERRALSTEMRRLGKAAHGRIGLGRTAMTDRVETQLEAYFGKKNFGFDLSLAPGGTPFQRLVWDELMRIPPGVTISYSELARRIGRQPAALRPRLPPRGQPRRPASRTADQLAQLRQPPVYRQSDKI